MRSDLVEGLTHCYKSAGTRLESSTFYLSRAQAAAQVKIMPFRDRFCEGLCFFSGIKEELLLNTNLSLEVINFQIIIHSKGTVKC